MEDDPTPLRNNQIVRSTSLIFSTLKFIVALRSKTLEPDVFRGTPLCMSQFNRLFSTARIPTKNGCYIAPPEEESRHIVVLAHSQFYHFDVFDDEGQIILTEKEISANLRAIVKDAKETPVSNIAQQAVGVLTTENRQNWAKLREELQSSGQQNADALRVVDTALFIVCLDHVEPADINELSTNMLCGTYRLVDGMQVGTCTNRWYDKLQVRTFPIHGLQHSHNNIFYVRLSFVKMATQALILNTQVYKNYVMYRRTITLLTPDDKL